jgi:PAS domain S-box-containing protein
MKELKLLERSIIDLERELAALRERRSEILRYYEDALEEKKENTGFNAVKKGTWKLILGKNEVSWSKELYEIFQFDKDIVGKELFEKYYSTLLKKDVELLNTNIEAILKGEKKDYYMLHPIKLDKNKTKWISCSAFPIFNEDTIIGLSGTVTEVNPYYENAQSLNQFFDQSVDLQCIANNKGYFIKISPSWSELLGYSDAELCSQPFINFVHPDDRNITVEEADDLDEGRPTMKFENRYIKKNGEIVYLNWNSRKDEVNGLFYCTARDVTQEKILQEAIVREAKEKEILLREIHHRVKNNLQIISSLLSLQAKMKYDKKTINQLLLESQNRVKAMASIHENFYQAKNIAKLQFNKYVSKLIHDLIFAFLGNDSKIQTQLNMDDCLVDLDTAVPLALIINEIISNSLKHGFIEDEGKPIISFELKSIESSYRIVIGDNGKGCKLDFNKENDDSLGLIIIIGLVEQIGGAIKQLPKSTGTWIELLIPK